ncbi:ABC transporter ATP-binding protein [Longispora fulva]|uniref:ABC-2 type transport system ATP-binding protein n=1 Tax=Longispora fulva TaxID=619741 RepID=A0A8J7GPP8_9ACTN|nr:ABC transporter ATP-binding protein [Longispora fulva]MBG6141610.1 ABC-2 type transport system ATP-binding protein [Longispora fulva]GIG59237.1 ABC transporter ATP-binding protein [Longispora fulva]
MIVAEHLTKRYGPKVVVDDLSFTVEPGRVTGFLGPNGAGKSTTMRMVLGLDRPTAGRVTVEGRPFAEAEVPLNTVGALLDAKAVHGGRTARNHLRVLARANGIPRQRVEEVLDMVGMADTAKKRIKGFSLGMGQRLGIAAALLGEPRTLMFDEPVNGLDPEGIRWIRDFLRARAAEGRAVFVSSHLMSEMQDTADHLIVIGRGKLVADCSMAEFIERSSRNHIRVRTPESVRFGQVLQNTGATVEPDGDALAVTKLPIEIIGELAARHGVTLHELAPRSASLEQAFMELTHDAVEYRATIGGTA